MDKHQFDHFIVENNLFFMDGLIEITFVSGSTNKAVWITQVPLLDKSDDGIFQGKPEQELFYLFDKGEYLVISIQEIADIKCIKKNYLGNWTNNL